MRQTKGASDRLLIFSDDARAYSEIITASLPELDMIATDDYREAQLHIGTVNIILATWLPDELLKQAVRLRWFASLAAGNERLLGSSALARDVIITKTYVYGEMMREYLFAYLLYFSRDISFYLNLQKNRVWTPLLPQRLRGKVIGILGLGAVGRVIAQGAKFFGMTVLGVNRSSSPVEYVDEVFPLTAIQAFLPRLDYLINVLPHTAETDGILGEAEFSQLQPGALFVNMGRGKTIDEQALIKVLSRKKIMALLDVFTSEPLPADSPLWAMENVTITPHVSGINLPREVGENFISNYQRWRKGEDLQGLVDRLKGY